MYNLDLEKLAAKFRDELFHVVLPFWDRYGIDHRDGGFMGSLDHDGRRVNDNKFHWFQGRGIWVYSYLYNHFGRHPHHLEVARKAKDFVLRHFALQGPFRGDLYGMYFAVEGLQEYAAAAEDEEALKIALDLFRRLHAEISRHDFGSRGQGLWMVSLLIATQIERRWHLADIAAIADEALDAILNRHYNQETGLNAEYMEEPAKCLIGHSVESLWMALDEALRRNDQKLYETCAQRIRHHLDVGWDHIYGGLATAIHVDQRDYQWPAERPVETGLEFRETGEYNYMKCFWAVNETQVAALNVFEHTGADWAARYFQLAQEVTEKKFSLRPRGFPLYLLFTDRQFSYQPNTWRQDNYHLPRQLMLNIQALERIAMRRRSV